MKRVIHLVVTIALLTGFSHVFAADSFSPDQRRDIEQIMHNYLINNPEILMTISEKLREKQREALMEKAQAAIEENKNVLFSAKSPSAGNPNGSLVLVEFFDYQCGHCRNMAGDVTRLIEKNPQLKVIFKQFPIFGKVSELAARAALAAQQQGKFLVLHEALMQQEKRLDPQLILKIAKKAGLNVKRLKKDMNSSAVSEELDRSMSLASAFALRGTPALVLANRKNAAKKPVFIPGAAGYDALQKILDELQ